MSMEDEIRAAMAELGLGDDPTPQSTQATKAAQPQPEEDTLVSAPDAPHVGDEVPSIPEDEPKPTAKAAAKPMAKVTTKPKANPAPVAPKNAQESPKKPAVVNSSGKIKVTHKSHAEVYLKIENGKLAVLIPDGMQTESRVINGNNYTVFTVGGFSGTFAAMGEVLKTVEVTRTPIQTVTEPMEPVELSDDLEELLDEKADLDNRIKTARLKGDTDTVESLRRERHKLRAQINKLKA